MTNNRLFHNGHLHHYLFIGGYASFSSDTLDGWHYYIQARQYDAIGVPGWNKPDPLAGKYTGLSPYSYCGGDPVNYGDYNGREFILEQLDENQLEKYEEA